MSLSDQELASGIKRGDEHSLKHLFDLYFHDLVVFSLKMVINTGVAEEIVEDVFIGLWNNRESFVLERDFKSYLFSAVRNRSLNYLKSKYGRMRFDDLDQLSLLTSPSTADSNLQLEELRQHIQGAIEKLPPKCRIIFSLSRNAGLSMQEIARQLGISIKTVQAQIAIAIKKIKANLH